MTRYFAKINKDNLVDEVIVCDTKTWINQNKIGEWVETFINSRNKEYAGVGYNYDRLLKDFYRPQPYPSWVLDINLEWQAPLPKPVIEGKFFQWNEEKLNWEESII